MHAGGARSIRAALTVALLVLVPLALAAPAGGAAPGAPAWTAGVCSDGKSVTVVVDFGTLGGGTVTRCAAEPVSSGFDALTKAGFTYEGTTRFPGLLCRIDDVPANDPCYNAPSPKYYWAYWTAPAPGGAWTYSDAGAGNRVPAPGSVEGWAFSDGCKRKPGASTTCPGATTTTAAPAPTTTASGAATTTAPASVSGQRRTSTSGPSRDREVLSTAGPTDPLPSDLDADLTVDPTAPEIGEPERDDDELAAVRTGRDQPSNDGGSPVGVLAGVGLALFIGASAAVRRHRRSAWPDTGSA